MFKCTECEKMYDIKPDYCDDCGNDTFEEIIETPVKQEKTEIKKEPEIIIEEVKPEVKKTIEKPKKEIDYPSVTFLGICILISLYIIFFAWNPKEEDKTAQAPQNNTVKQSTNIPTSVNGFWNNELPKVEPKPVVKAPWQVEQVQQPPQQIQVQPVIAKAPEVKKAPQTVQKQEPKQVQPTPPKQVQTKPAQTSQKPAQQTQKPAQTTQTKPAQTTQKPVQTTQKPAQTTQKPAQTKPAQQTTQTVWQSSQQPTQIQSAQTQQTVDTTALKKELANYKVNLRNTIGRKIDFANVIGDGSCTVSFKIDSNGKLVNRAFSQQSTNTTLNDAVYAAVMATPSYNPPPKGYNNETLHLKISFYNGNFQISLN